MKLKHSNSPGPLLKWALAAASLIAFVVIARLTNTSPPTNSAQTSSDASDSALKSRVYQVSWTRAVGVCEAVLSQQRTYFRRWKKGRNSVRGTTMGAQMEEVLRYEVPVFVFTDDFEVTLRDEGEGKIRIDARSAARLGKGDFGENRRHLRQFLTALDEKLKAQKVE